MSTYGVFFEGASIKPEVHSLPDGPPSLLYLPDPAMRLLALRPPEGLPEVLHSRPFRCLLGCCGVATDSLTRERFAVIVYLREGTEIPGVILSNEVERVLRWIGAGRPDGH